VKLGWPFILQSLQRFVFSFLLAIAPRNLAERFRLLIGRCIHGLRLLRYRRLLRHRRRSCLPPRFDLSLIFWCENPSSLQIVIGIDMTGRLRFFFLASPLLTCGFRNILTPRLRRKYRCNEKEYETENRSSTRGLWNSPHGRIQLHSLASIKQQNRRGTNRITTGIFHRSSLGSNGLALK
jgi:hypothetical protein